MNETTPLNIEIKETYKGTSPPFDVAKTVRKLLLGIPRKYTNGLGTVVIRDAQSFNRKRKRQKYNGATRNLAISECGGFYHDAYQGEPAWIEIIIDQIIPNNCSMIEKTSFFRELMISEVLFHEIGHHVHKTISPEYKGRETVADEWKKKLTRYYFRHKYGYIIVPLWILSRPFKKMIEKSLKKCKRL